MMEKLYLGVAREIITPEIGSQMYGYRPDIFSESVADDLTVTAFYFRQGDVQALMLSITVCLIQTELAGQITARIEKEFGIPREACMLSATHTHSGPNTAGQTGWGDIDNTYCDGIFIPGILKAVERAMADPVPVKMGSAGGTSLVGINRRELNDKNKIILGQNPWGCFDPRMTVLSFVTPDGKTLANMIHYGAHGTAAGHNSCRRSARGCGPYRPETGLREDPHHRQRPEGSDGGYGRSHRATDRSGRWPVLQ